MNKMEQPSGKAATGSHQSLDKLCERLAKSKAIKPGSIAFQLGGSGGGRYFLDCAPGRAQVREGDPPSKAAIEIIGDANTIQSILDGKKDARAQFIAGGFRVRGDLRYLSDLALELGIIDTPL